MQTNHTPDNTPVTHIPVDHAMLDQLSQLSERWDIPVEDILPALMAALPSETLEQALKDAIASAHSS
ncbi:hypothetical protein [Akkermansia glycaniphila]|uniref:Uncharacterized protein n=1 Tax=Akkermansia glycaniphila TaxID=1679444 RepID=A0A1C7PDK4_9BACT|nr:hypothetical protein [Akkermansia glycaniphila]OCA03666.1 hypothetical protein AC781_03405 [Akkermansia glycaniphila]SEH86913.1 Hypothetical protein PYTT_1332 [Akkermansia glycaniphila]